MVLKAKKKQQQEQTQDDKRLQRDVMTFALRVLQKIDQDFNGSHGEEENDEQFIAEDEQNRSFFP